MKINGIGNVKKEDMIKILGESGKEALKDGSLSMDELSAMYKLEMVKEKSVIGDCPDTFRRNYDRIPNAIKEKLSPEEIASLVDEFYRCYNEKKD